MQDAPGCHHLPLGPADAEGNEGHGRLWFLPGSDGRARRIGARFEDPRTIESDRRHDCYLGTLDVDGAPFSVGAVSTGMGCPSLGIVVTELIGLGARLLLRVGTSGSLQPESVPAGSLVIATGAVRDEGASEAYADRGYPALADPDVVRCLERAARACGHGERTFRGVVHAKDSLYGREFGLGPRAASNEAYMRELTALGVLASEMESSHLFVLAAASSHGVEPLGERPGNGRVRAGSLLAVIGDAARFMEADAAAAVEEAVIDVALAGAAEIARLLRAG